MPIDQRIIDALEASGVEYDKDNYSPAKSFGTNGIDSLDVMSLFLTLEEAFGVKFTEDEANSIQTPQEITVALDKHLS